MAAPVKNALRIPLSYSRARILQRCAVLRSCSNYSSKPDDSEQNTRVPKVGMSEDGRTLIGWHPEPEHPYEHTQAIKYDMQEAQDGTVLKDSVIRNYMLRYRASGPNIPELANLTFTTKHRWFPKPEKKYRKRNPPKDRDAV